MLPAGLKLYHIRHGQTDYNAEGRLQGQRDVPMNAVGTAQAAQNGAKLAKWFAESGTDPAGLDYVSSPLGRAVETMRIVREALGLAGTWRTDPRLMEVSFGDWAGFTYDDLRADGRADAVARRKKDKWSFRPPAGETYAELAARVEGFLRDVSRDTVVVSHGGVFRVLQGHLADAPWHRVPSIEAPQDKVHLFEGGWVSEW